MSGFLRFKKLTQIAAAVVAVVSLSQCALPPGTAWTVIRKDGLKDYFAISWGKKPVPDYVKELVPEAFGLPTPQPNEEENKDTGLKAAGEPFPKVPGTLPEDWTRPVEPVFPLMETEPPTVADGSSTAAAARDLGVNPLLGVLANDEFAHVDLPVASKPLVAVDDKVKRAAPGLKIKDPLAIGPSSRVLNHLAQGLKPNAVSIVEESGAVEEKQEAKPEMTKVKGNDVNMAKFLSEMMPASVNEDVPFGLLVEGRPGYVRSPYAQSHQIVDVTGLKVGTSVECPFSGKFFRVPAAHAAMNDMMRRKETVQGR